MQGLDSLQEALGYRFNQLDLLTQALTHKSYAYEHKMSPHACNERLEFLGDAVLEVCISDMLFTRFPALSEGKLTRRRAALVCEATLADVARGFSLGAHMRLGHGEATQGGGDKGSLLSDVFEALLGAMYVDGGFEAVRALVDRVFAPYLTRDDIPRDYKTALQELLQKESGETAVYDTLTASGPPHDRVFTVQVVHRGRVLAEGSGTSKKSAEQDAAAAALNKMKSR